MAKLSEELYKYTKEDRERAINTFDNLKERINKMERVGPGILEQLNAAQQLIQTSTEKLISLTNILNKKETNIHLQQLNMDFSPDLLEDDVETLNDRKKRLGVNKK